MGSEGTVRANVLGTAHGFFLVLVGAAGGYHSEPDIHEHPEFLYFVDRAVQSLELARGDGYAGTIGSSLDLFASRDGAPTCRSSGSEYRRGLRGHGGRRRGTGD
jgi:hypothetical protein